MIISRVEGGIGSQMCCYATARGLAHKLNTELKLDLEWHRWCLSQPFALDQFSAAEKFVESFQHKTLSRE